jgi:tRNA dimethylallyltransferase
LILVLGPTGAGKSDLALHLAERFSGEIVNCDSVQLYRGFDIGTAKVPVAERRGIPHHLLDILEPHELCSAGEYARLARPILMEITSRGRIPIVTGGTGFYVRALLYGLFSGPERDEALRDRLTRLEHKRSGFLHRALRRLDSAAAARIHANDRHKLIRAIEVCLKAKTSISELFQTGRDALEGFRWLKLGLDPPRAALYQRLDERCRRMLEGGLIEETTSILGAALTSEIKPLESIGYKQVSELIKGELSFDQALEAMQIATRRYAKRQLTWFRKEPEMQWLSGFGTQDAVLGSAVSITANWLLRV